MTETADAVVVGAGLNGAATAFFLLRQGIQKLFLLDALPPGAGASGAAVGLLRTHYDNRPETELAAKSMPYFRHWQDLTGQSCGWLQTGFFRFVEAHETTKMERNVAFQREFGEIVEILTGREVHERAPEFRTDDIGAAVYEPGSGTASNSQAVLSLLSSLKAAGAKVETDRRVTRVITAGGRVTGVMTVRGEIETPIVVLAAGVASRHLAETCGVSVPLVAKAIRVAEIVPPAHLRAVVTYMDPISDSWLTIREGGRALISAVNPSAGLPIDPDSIDSEFPRVDAEAGLDPVEHRVPGMAHAAIARWWMRPDCYAPDGKPIIGSAEESPGLFLNTAGAGKGHKVAPAAGKALAELIAEGQSRSADISPFRLSRFQKPLRRWSDSEYGKRVIG